MNNNIKYVIVKLYFGKIKKLKFQLVILSCLLLFDFILPIN